MRKAVFFLSFVLKIINFKIMSLHNSTKKTLSFAAACLLAVSGLSAQGVLWGAGSTNTRIDSIGRFASPDGTLTSLGWTTNSVYCTNLNGQPSNSAAWTRDSSCATALWSISLTGKGTGWSSGGTAVGTMQSTSVNDGIAIFDTDFLDNAGQVVGGQPVFGAGTAPNGYTTTAGVTRWGVEGYMTSPSIDLTGQAGQSLVLEMNSRLRWLAGYQTMFRRLAVSIDGGSTWTTYDVNGSNAGHPAANNLEVIDISSSFTNAAIAANPNADLANCMIRFHMAGGYYYWMIDDVKIKEKPAYDLGISPLGAGNTLGDDFTVFRVSNNRYQPFVQIDSSEYQFGAKVVNKGAQTIPMSANPRLNIEIVETGTTTPIIHSQSLMLGQDLGADSSVTLTEQLTWLPDDSLSYDVRYFVQHDNPDGSTANDSSFATFEVTRNYFSKCRRDATDGYPVGARTIFPAAGAGNLVSEFEYGSMFFFPQGTSQNTKIDSVGFRVFWSNSTLQRITSAEVNVRVYQFNDGDASGTLADDGSELSIAGIGSATINKVANSYVIAKADIFDVGGNPGLDIVNGGVYLVTLNVTGANNVAPNPPALETAQDSLYTPLFGADQLNYGINASAVDGVNPSPVRVAEISAANNAPVSNDWNWVGFGADLQPSIGFWISGDFLIGVEEQGAAADVSSFNVFPNPTKDVLNINVELKEASNVNYILSGVNGQVIRMVTHKNVQSEVMTFNVAELPAGVYFVSIKTEKGFSTQRFIKE
jgi:Secretion system C-terminal sorting domain